MQNIKYVLVFLILCSCSQPEKQNKGNNIKPTEIVSKIDTIQQEQPNTTTSLINTEEDKAPIKEEIVKVAEPEKIKEEPVKPKPVIKKIGSLHIEAPIFDFGRVLEGAIVEHEFKIENRGNAPLLITDIEVDCGCTVPEYSKEPIPPGGQEVVKIIFDTKGKLASQMRFITIYTNGKPLSKLVRLKGMVTTD